MLRKPVIWVLLIMTLLTAVVLLFLSQPTREQSSASGLLPTREPEIQISTFSYTPSLLPPSTTTPPPAAAPAEPTGTSTASPQPTALPTEHSIRSITGHKQFFHLGCESAAAKDWAKFLGYDFNEFEFQYRLPISDNPDFGFVGNVNSPWGQVPPYAYGVYAGPVAELLNTYGISAKAFKGYTLDEIKANVAQEKPVIVWVIGNVVGGIPSEYTDSKGNRTIVAAYEHVVIVTGYNEGHIRYMTNGKFFDTPNEVFLNSWGVLGNMAITTGK